MTNTEETETEKTQRELWSWGIVTELNRVNRFYKCDGTNTSTCYGDLVSIKEILRTELKGTKLNKDFLILPEPIRHWGFTYNLHAYTQYVENPRTESTGLVFVIDCLICQATIRRYRLVDMMQFVQENRICVHLTSKWMGESNDNLDSR